MVVRDNNVFAIRSVAVNGLMKTYLRKIGKNGNKRAEKFRKDLTSPKSIQTLQKA